ncbi:MAG: FAD-linked oxidase C-terminal domain-containing protein [Polynucleobacter sp.]|nr:FAD-linked oxidase C-terminal domain-containing protein [Polynucleobacter sp.]
MSLPLEVISQLQALLGDRFSLAKAVRDQHGRDESPYPEIAPDAVAFAWTNEEVAGVVQLCNAHRVPVVAYGAGSSLEGHVLAIQGGICLDLSHMNAILELAPDDFLVTVQAGVLRKQLNQEIKNQGLFFPVDPGADATIGGMCATRASGTNAVRYGTMRENVVALTVVTSSGKIIRVGSRARKSAAGYDLTRLLIGSEGTLGVITEITLKLYPLPEAISAATCVFPSVSAAVQAVIAIIQYGIPIARVELVDETAITAINHYSKLSLEQKPTLFFEFHGSPLGVQEQSENTQAICAEYSGSGFEWSANPEDRTRLWQARHNAYYACLQLQAGARILNTDICVPISKLAYCIDRARDLLSQSYLKSAILGHVGDGNFHALIIIDPNRVEDMQEAERLNHCIVQDALSVGGTCTGEHGVGMHKIQFMLQEHGADAIECMRAIKAVFDPNNILNPGKMLPAQPL